MRIGCLQFAPQVGDVDNNLNRADSVLSKANPEDLDLLVLPELAFSGEFLIPHRRCLYGRPEDARKVVSRLPEVLLVLYRCCAPYN